MRNDPFGELDADDLDEDPELRAATIESQVADFIRKLAGNRPARVGIDGSVDADQRVLLDICVDGCRYILTRTVPKPAPAQEVLSPREQEISRMIAKGYPNKTIASVLDISAWTVCTHLRRIFAKLGVSSRAAMVARLKDEYPSMFSSGGGAFAGDS
jgi:DNA-binding NarL/FixJ family response regulator